MLFPFRRPRALLLSVPIVAASAFSAEGSPAAGGWAFNLSANFNAGGVNTAIEPYNVTNTVTAGVFDRTFNASAFGNRLILLTVDAAGPVLTYGVSKSLQTHVSQPFAPSSGTSAVVTKATLSGLTLPSRGGKPNPLFVTTYLHITADSIQQTGNFNRLASKATTVSSEAAIHNLVVTGTLVDGKTLKFSGVPTAEDQVLFHSPHRHDHTGTFDHCRDDFMQRLEMFGDAIFHHRQRTAGHPDRRRVGWKEGVRPDHDSMACMAGLRAAF